VPLPQGGRDIGGQRDDPIHLPFTVDIIGNSIYAGKSVYSVYA
jgi:hypothetical protein